MIQAKDLVRTVLSSREKKTLSDVDRQYFGVFATTFVRRLRDNNKDFEGEVMKLVSDLLKENSNDN